MMKNMWTGLAILIFLLTLVWVLKSQVTGVGTILGLTFLTALIYMLVAFAIIMIIIKIIKWSTSKFE
jgi:hypothetical protein